MENLLKSVEIAEVHEPISAGSSTDENTDIIDMKNWEGVIFIVPITDSVDTGVATLTIEQNTANSDSGMAALSGAAHAATSAANDDLNNTLLIVDIFRPRERYVQGVITSATANIAFGTAIAIKYGPRKKPVSQGDTVQDDEVVLASPAEA